MPLPWLLPFPPQELAGLGSNWDASQRDALQQALSRRVALIQGPPGTGKTFIGVHLLDTILRRWAARCAGGSGLG